MESNAIVLEHGLIVRKAGNYGKACTWLQKAHNLMKKPLTESTSVLMPAEERAVQGE